MNDKIKHPAPTGCLNTAKNFGNTGRKASGRKNKPTRQRVQAARPCKPVPREIWDIFYSIKPSIPDRMKGGV